MRRERGSVGVVSPSCADQGIECAGGVQMRYIGLDIHRDFAEVAVVEPGHPVRSWGRIVVRPAELRAFAATLRNDDAVALEATINTWAIARLLGEHAGRVVTSNPYRTRAIAEAKIKTDRVDATVLAQLLAADYLPSVWEPDERTQMLRRLVGRRARLVQQRTRLRNQVHAVLHRNLVGGAPVSDIFGVRGQAWLRALLLPLDERSTIESALRLLEALATELHDADAELARLGRPDPAVGHLLTIPGVDAAVAMGVLATIGDIRRFGSPQQLVSISASTPGCISPAASRPTRGTSASRDGPMPAACSPRQRGRPPSPRDGSGPSSGGSARGGPQIAAVATARKLAVLAWYLLTRDEDYAWAGSALTATKLRRMELTAGPPHAAVAAAPGRRALRESVRRNGPSRLPPRSSTHASSAPGGCGHGTRVPQTGSDSLAR
jgi:transposase